MEDLELLKQDWNSDKDEFIQYSESDIYQMLKKKSVSVANFLLVAGIIEVSLWFLGDLFLFITNKSNFNDSSLNQKYFYFFVFIGTLFYLNQKIKNTYNAKDLMRSIVWLRRTVQIYVTLYLILIFTTFYSLFKLSLFQEMKGNLPDNKIIIMLSVSFLLSLAIFFTLIFIYKLVYGKSLQILNKNYKELNKV